MSLFPDIDIWWQSPPPPSSGEVKVDSDDVRSRCYHPIHNRISDARDENRMTERKPNSGHGTKHNNIYHAAVIHTSTSYGSTHHHDENDMGKNNGILTTTTTTTAPTLYEGETLLPMVYSPPLIDNNENDHNDVPSDISTTSSSDADIDEDESIEIIEQPHRTMGLIFFDFIRCIAVSANVRCLNTQLMPIFMSMGGSGIGAGMGMGGNNKKSNANQLDALSVALRLFISLFSILLILVEFPDVFPCLQHAIPSHEPTTSPPPSVHATSSTMSASSPTAPPLLVPSQSLSPPPPPPPPLYISNWIPRGIFYIFLSIICLEQSLVVRAFDNERHVNSYSRFFDGFFIVVSAYIMAAMGVVYVLLGMCCCQRIMERVRRDEKEKWTEYYEKVMEMELQEEEEAEVEERRKLMPSSSSSLEWVKEVKNTNGKRRKVRTIDEEEENQDEKQNVIGWVQWYCFGRCCWQRWLRWWRRNRWQRRKNRRSRWQRQQTKKGCGLCQHLGCRTVDWRL